MTSITITPAQARQLVLDAASVEVAKDGPLVPEVGTWYLQPATQEEVQGLLLNLTEEKPVEFDQFGRVYFTNPYLGDTCRLTF